MTDNKLRDRLRRVNETAPAIQGAAAAMMNHYDRSTDVAVTEWRNALNIADNDQILPLLYVANEVLQNSKRNRGNKFLEAFSPVLQQSLVYMAQQLESTFVEKIRRTVKIWGDRYVFSMRYINGILVALEPFRTGHTRPKQQQEQRVEATFSPSKTETSATPNPNSATSKPDTADDSHKNATDTTSHDDIMEILEAHDKDNQDHSDNDDMMFDDSEQGQKLAIEIDIDAVASQVRPQKRRRRGSNGSSAAATKRTNKILSNNNMLDLWNQLNTNQQTYQLAISSISRIEKNIEKVSNDDLANLVGDELQHAVQQNASDMQTMIKYKAVLHELANERHDLEHDATKYLFWLESAVRSDDDDVLFSETLQEKLSQLLPIHMELSKLRQERILLQRQQEAQERERERLQQEQRELKAFARVALSKEKEAKPGMVWNPSTREYQVLNTDESWRD